ncbi:MAG: universal stress protein [Syntrophobacteraceae bacterium]
MKILLALDSSDKAIDEAVKVAREKNAKLTGIFVLDSTWNEYIGHDWLSGSNARAGFLDYIKTEEDLEAGRATERFVTLAADVPHEFKARAGRVPDVIIEELAAGYDMLIMGYPFRRGLEVVRDPLPKILKGSGCSVLLVR